MDQHDRASGSHSLKGGRRIAVITSRENLLYKLYNSTKTNKGRRKHRLFLVEGPHLAAEALAASYPLHSVLVAEDKFFFPQRPSWLLPLLQQAEAGDVPVYRMTGALFCRLAETETPRGILALAMLPETMELPAPGGFLGLLLNGVRDPGNVGMIMRTAWAAGVKDLFLTPGTADPYSGKAVRASQGGIFHLRLHRRPLTAFLNWAKETAVTCWVGDPHGGEDYYQADFSGPTLFVLGHETQGPEKAAREGGKSVRIPLPGGAESLNVAVSAGILLYEALRQRNTRA
ncbi:MAG: RNA methyltransferase [Firmicutes bacterium]|nr:RNA methyltransferase [Bacillota bacterium]